MAKKKVEYEFEVITKVVASDDWWVKVDDVKKMLDKIEAFAESGEIGFIYKLINKCIRELPE